MEICIPGESLEKVMERRVKSLRLKRYSFYFEIIFLLEDILSLVFKIKVIVDGEPRTQCLSSRKLKQVVDVEKVWTITLESSK